MGGFCTTNPAGMSVGLQKANIGVLPSGESEAQISVGVRLKGGVIGSGYGPPDDFDHRAAGGVGLA